MVRVAGFEPALCPMYLVSQCKRFLSLTPLSLVLKVDVTLKPDDFGRLSTPALIYGAGERNRTFVGISEPQISGTCSNSIPVWCFEFHPV